MRPTFVDVGLDARLQRDGYAVVSLLDSDGVAALRSAFGRLGPAPGDPGMACHSTFHTFDADYKVSVDESIRAVVEGPLGHLFDRYRMLPCNFIVKWPGGRSGFGLHQDLSLVDERLFRSVEVWIALDDTTEENGQLWVAPGSHQWLPHHIRGIHAFPFPFRDVTRRIIRRHSVPVPLRQGEAIVFDHGVLHFSMPNRGTAPRLVAITDLIPEEAHHLHFFGHDGRVRAYRIDESFWIRNNPFTLSVAPPDAELVGEIGSNRSEVVDDAFLDRLVAAGRAIESAGGPRGAINPAKPWCHRCGSSNVAVDPPDRWIGNVTLLCPVCRTEEQRRAAVALAG